MGSARASSNLVGVDFVLLEKKRFFLQKKNSKAGN
jgi:hypothetical protein